MRGGRLRGLVGIEQKRDDRTMYTERILPLLRQIAGERGQRERHHLLLLLLKRKREPRVEIMSGKARGTARGGGLEERVEV